MKCHRPEFLNVPQALPAETEEARPVFPDTLTDYLTGKEMPFSNRDNIRQKMVRFLVEEKGFGKEDIIVDREIRYDVDGTEMISLVDISIVIDGRTLIVWKCASGSVVSRERQIMASARLIEDYVVPFAVVTNGKDIELLDTSTEKVHSEGFDAIPSRDELRKISGGLSLRLTNRKKLANEQRVLYTYDAISCPSNCKTAL